MQKQEYELCGVGSEPTSHSLGDNSLSKFKPKLEKKLILPKLFIRMFRFAGTSLIATAVDLMIFIGLTNSSFPAVQSHVFSSLVGMLFNFNLQKRFVFLLKGKVWKVFSLSIGFSFLGIFISSWLFWLISQIAIFGLNPAFTKIVVIGLMFFYNFFTKKLAFEKKI
jgi:putative flippase GtrA